MKLQTQYPCGFAMIYNNTDRPQVFAVLPVHFQNILQDINYPLQKIPNDRTRKDQMFMKRKEFVYTIGVFTVAHRSFVCCCNN